MKNSIIERMKKDYSVKRAINLVSNDFDTSRIEELLRNRPEESRRVAQRAINMCENFATWPSLLLGISLVNIESPDAVNVFDKLIQHNENPYLAKKNPVCWDRIKTDKLKVILNYLRDNNSVSILERFLKQLSVDQFFQLIPNISDNEFTLFIKAYIENNKSIDKVRDYIVDYLERSVLWDPDNLEIPSLVLSNCTEVVKIMWNYGKVDDSLEIIALISELDSSCIDDDMVACVADSLDCCEGLSLVRAANLLRTFASKDWVPYLKPAWIRLLTASRGKTFDLIKSGVKHPNIKPEEVAATNAVAIALGLCAAYDEEYKHLELEADASKQFQNLIDKRKHLLEKRNRLVRDFQSETGVAENIRDEEIAERINTLNDSIDDLNKQIYELKEIQMQQHSAGYLLLIALKDEQEYAPDIRQGAAWGLYKLKELGYLDETSRNYISESIRFAICGSGKDELRNRINQEIIFDKDSSQTVYEASLKYLYSGNLSQFLNSLESLLTTNEQVKKITNIVKSLFYHEFSYHFSERRIQFLPGQALLELEKLIIDGINWMEDLVEDPDYESGSESDLFDYKNIRIIVKLMSKLMPKILEFFSMYPLRLMTLDQHKRILGQYVRNKCDIIYWTRYTPPIWKPGTSLDEVGEVHERYLTLDDRSTPNAMGIYYRLFSHPILCLPVLYHEYLHFGGTEGEPSKGIENETNVLFREIIFTRDLIAKLAPNNNESIPEYELELIKAIRETGLWGLLIQMSYDLYDNAVLNSICDQVESAYGKPLGSQKAKQEINNSINFQNREILRMNLTNDMKRNWYPSIEWPEMATPKTKFLTKEFERILFKNFTCDRRINIASHDQILADPYCQKSLENWQGYLKRPNTLQEFKKAWMNVSMQQALNYIVHRVEPISIDSQVSINKFLKFYHDIFTN